MPDWLILVFGVVILALVASDRRNIGSAWKNPARWWGWRSDEYWRSRAPSQPLNVLLGLGLGIAAVVYGLLSLIR
jgi:hypothetical protein